VNCLCGSPKAGSPAIFKFGSPNNPMPRISEQKVKKICEQALEFLYLNHPASFFTSQIAGELARDEEFMKTILSSLEAKQLVRRVTKSPTGEEYLERTKWALSPATKEKYSRLYGARGQGGTGGGSDGYESDESE